MRYCLEITTQIGCANLCRYCPQDKLLAAYSQRNGIRRMSFDAFKACLDKVPPHVIIHFTGMSEPWLNPECTRMLIYAHEKGHKIRVRTTLRGMGEEDIFQLEKVPFLEFSVHVPSTEAGMSMDVAEKYFNLFEKIASSGIRHLAFHAHGKTIEPALRAIIAKKKKKIVLWPSSTLLTRAGNISLDKVPTTPRKKKILGCVRLLQQNILLPNGDVVLCCMDYGLQHILGNLLTGSYEGLFTSDEFLKVKRGLRQESADVLCKFCYGFTFETFIPGKVWPFLSKRRVLRS